MRSWFDAANVPLPLCLAPPCPSILLPPPTHRTHAPTVQEIGYDRSKFEIFVDGGVRRGSDIFKAVALGATAVGIGRPVLYSLASYGQAGVERMVQMFKDELTMVMRLSGTPTIADITRRHVILKGAPRQARHNLFLDTYQPMRTARGRL